VHFKALSASGGSFSCVQQLSILFKKAIGFNISLIFPDWKIHAKIFVYKHIKAVHAAEVV
jgi:hypothetical protein